MEFVRWRNGYQGYITNEEQHSLHHPKYSSIGRSLPPVIMSSHVDRWGQDFYSEIWHSFGFGFSMEKNLHHKSSAFKVESRGGNA